jgi:hypothetical protein
MTPVNECNRDVTSIITELWLPISDMLSCRMSGSMRKNALFLIVAVLGTRMHGQQAGEIDLGRHESDTVAVQSEADCNKANFQVVARTLAIWLNYRGPIRRPSVRVKG